MSEPFYFLGLYTGKTVASATLLGCTSDPVLVQAVVDKMLAETLKSRPEDAAAAALHAGQRAALHIAKMMAVSEEGDGLE